MSQIFRYSKKRWDEEYESGTWEFLDSPIEKSRSAIIGMLCSNFRRRGSILDVGCGVGTLIDFLDPDIKKKYVGVDISKAAIKRLRKAHEVVTYVANADSYKPKQKFDIIIFNEVLYYLNGIDSLLRYLEYLNGKGVIIISMYRPKEHSKRDKVNKLWRSLRHHCRQVYHCSLIDGRRNKSTAWEIQVIVKKS